MRRSKLEKAKGRKESGNFAQIPVSVLVSAEFHSITGEAVRLLVAIAAQFNGYNNGNMNAALTDMRKYGFTSQGTLSRALLCLLNTGLIIKTRQGFFMPGKNRCSLYAIAWRPIDACPGKNLSVKPTSAPPKSFHPATPNKSTRPIIGKDSRSIEAGTLSPSDPSESKSASE